MSTETIFFSYSRDDSEFVLQLAKNLRQAGANIWLDQLDISPGSRWDKSIEDALTTSKTLLVVLSKTSVASDNVLDEVSFALEEGKRVVPVLLENCEIPFRLRRLQYADFTENREKGIHTLIQALHLDRDVASRLSDFVGTKSNQKTDEDLVKAKGTVEIEKKPPLPQQSKQVAHKKKATNPHDSSDKKQKPRSKTPLRIILGLLVLAALAAATWFGGFFPEDEDTQFFKASLKDNTIQDFEIYIKRFPEGKFIDQARDSIYAKTSRNKIKIENEAWNEASKNDNLDGYHAYLKKFPNGNHVQEAEAKIKTLSGTLENIRLDDEAWETASAQATVSAYLDYYTNQATVGAHREKALQKIHEIGLKGWLYCGRFSGDLMTESIFDLIWRAEDFSEKEILKTHDVVMLKTHESARRTYKYADNRNTNNANSTLIEKNKKMYVLAVKKEGNALVVQVIY
jgi:hypothetical protein